MNLEYFQEMEQRLLVVSEVNPEVVNLLIPTLRLRMTDVQEARDRRHLLRHRTLRRILLDPYKHWRNAVSSYLGGEVSTDQVSAAMPMVADISVLFTRRDWGVAGTLSVMASNAIVLTSP
jgi:hypothetical protein